MSDTTNTDTVSDAPQPALTRAPVRTDSPTFAELGVRSETVEALATAGITRAFAIQEYALPIALRGTDLIGQAPTGTGKTLGFGIPLLERVVTPAEGGPDGFPQALVVVPTRELGSQVARDIAAAGATRGVRVLALYGGVAYETQIDTLKKGVEILVSTPGRLLDLAKQKQLRLDRVTALVLDEADRMLDLGFLDDVEKILAMLPVQRQTMLFSATMPDPIVALARRFLTHPVNIHAGHSAETGPSPLTKQVVYRTHPMNKLEMVARVLQAQGRGLTMIFTRTKRAADRVAEDLDFRGFAVAAVHGDLGQSARERALRAFRTGKIDVLVATDVAARGLDVSGVTHVVNFDCPEDPDTYTHRIGRTGRAGATGVAVTFVDWEDMPRWVLIDKSMGLDMPQPPETYHTSPALYADLEIPTEVSGTLPTAGRTRIGLSAEIEEDLGGTRRRGRSDAPRGRSDSGRGDSGRGDSGRARGGDTPGRGGDAPGRGRSRGRGRTADGIADGPSPADDTVRSDGATAPDATEIGTTEVGDRPKRQRRRRRVDDGTALGAGDGTALTTGDGALADASPARLNGDGQDGPAREAAGLAAPERDSSGVDDVATDDADSPGRPRRRRRRGGRGSRTTDSTGTDSTGTDSTGTDSTGTEPTGTGPTGTGPAGHGSAGPDMTGGSEAGVGTAE